MCRGGYTQEPCFSTSHLQVGFALFIGPVGDSQVCSDRVGACDHRGCREWSIYCKLWHIRARLRRLTHTRCCGETAFALCAATLRQTHIARHTHTPACKHIGDHFPGPARMHFPLPAAVTGVTATESRVRSGSASRRLPASNWRQQDRSGPAHGCAALQFTFTNR